MFLPCAPNPTTGFFFYVPKSKIIEIDMSAEDAATLIMSAGVVQPGSDPQKKIAALAGMANAARVANSSALQPATGEGGLRLPSHPCDPHPGGATSFRSFVIARSVSNDAIHLLA